MPAPIVVSAPCGKYLNYGFLLTRAASTLISALVVQDKQKAAIENFMRMVKPGGVLVIDHRNYDEILETGSVPAKNIYYNVSTLYVLGDHTLQQKYA